ncbi:PREDICTED: uncharacterized protein LOC106148787 [Chinchilla lanigera]|uniref:uncharacterized protein LOC106148787 n=1 Tax=Chinchilla lanigera TaxID=34839 RepID=UPI0006962B13|nr:PREDICTED: uncharacterized protein LOC106148787 [Chinchilla lanigera]
MLLETPEGIRSHYQWKSTGGHTAKEATKQTKPEVSKAFPTLSPKGSPLGPLKKPPPPALSLFFLFPGRPSTTCPSVPRCSVSARSPLRGPASEEGSGRREPAPRLLRAGTWRCGPASAEQPGIRPGRAEPGRAKSPGIRPALLPRRRAAAPRIPAPAAERGSPPLRRRGQRCAGGNGTVLRRVRSAAATPAIPTALARGRASSHGHGRRDCTRSTTTDGCGEIPDSAARTGPSWELGPQLIGFGSALSAQLCCRHPEKTAWGHRDGREHGHQHCCAGGFPRWQDPETRQQDPGHRSVSRRDRAAEDTVPPEQLGNGDEEATPTVTSLPHARPHLLEAPPPPAALQAGTTPSTRGLGGRSGATRQRVWAVESN